jgi:hypothetical protein
MRAYNSDITIEEFRLSRNSPENRPSLGGLSNISNVLTRRGSEIRPVTTGIPGEPEKTRDNDDL